MKEEEKFPFEMKFGIKSYGRDQTLYTFQNDNNPIGYGKLKIYYEREMNERDLGYKVMNEIIKTFLEKNKKGSIKVQSVDMNNDELNKGLKKKWIEVRKYQSEQNKEK
ncbi:MAG: hypothetical protein KC516_02940 [Nanoarchaeota archaeon]|nr:hypothetical protein [Nanoarchaeota archaeon]